MTALASYLTLLGVAEERSPERDTRGPLRRRAETQPSVT